MEQEILSAFFGDEQQINGEVEISSEPFSVVSDIIPPPCPTPSVWEPRPGCNPVNEKAVHDLLVWEEKWNKQIMERNKKSDEELCKVSVPEPVPWAEPVPWPEPVQWPEPVPWAAPWAAPLAAPLAAPWTAPTIGKSNMRKRKHSVDSSYVAAASLLKWEDKWDQQHHTTCRNVFSLDLPETNDVEMMDLEEIAYPVTGAPMDQSQPQMQKIKKAVPGHWGWLYSK